uniref:NADH-ubiquinone oxidoreductase chain 4 n=1 Tax=Goniomonas avonlea TaxID=1255295 RepID=A0A348G6N2_9CRYP|nr:NADH dehydrogenase subunit 4 [Goniomonas avonlea]
MNMSELTTYLLPAIIFIPIFGIALILLIPREETQRIFNFGLCISLFTFFLSQFLWLFFDNASLHFQFISSAIWIPYMNIIPVFGVDGISIFFILLTTLLIPMCILASWKSVTTKIKEFIISFLILEASLCIVFSALDVLVFYIFFETVLIPMFLIIGIWGSRTRKVRAAYQFFLYTLVGSLLMLLAIFSIAFQTGTTDLQVLLSIHDFLWSEERQLLIWFAFFCSFAVKIPMLPFHIWLPEAHVEAPTAGSVILAGILLKLGAYGFLRFSISLLPEASIFFTPFIYTLSVLAIVYTSLTTLRQIDLKKIIAYSSVAHMGLVTIGLFSNNLQGIEGAILIMLSHGFVSSALFLCVGVLYERHHTRILKYYTGLAQTMPIFAIVFLFFSLANLGFPGTSSFVGEFLVIVGAIQSSVFVTLFAASGMVFCAAYSIWLCNRLLFGEITSGKLKELWYHNDLDHREIAIFLPLIFFTLFMGCYPVLFLDCIQLSVVKLLFG